MRKMGITRLLDLLFTAVIIWTVSLLIMAAGGTVQTGQPEAGIRLPIIMYHSIVNDPSRWGPYVISEAELNSDLKYLRAHGYTPVTVRDLLDYEYEGGELPEKPVMLTFDDGYYNNYCYAFPLLKEYDMKAVVSIVGKFTDQYSLLHSENPAYSHINWDQAREMTDSGLVELQNHSYDLHSISNVRSASMMARGETAEHYHQVLASDAMKLQALIDGCAGQLPTAYTYPFGLISGESVGILKELGFKCTLTCYSGVNTITRDPDCLFLLKRNLRPHGKGVGEILGKYK